MKANREVVKDLKLRSDMMIIKFKKSRITDWWVAESNLKMAFFNILSGELGENLLVVGYLDREKEVKKDIYRSIDSKEEIRKKVKSVQNIFEEKFK